MSLDSDLSGSTCDLCSGVLGSRFCSKCGVDYRIVSVSRELELALRDSGRLRLADLVLDERGRQIGYGQLQDGRRVGACVYGTQAAYNNDLLARGELQSMTLGLTHSEDRCQTPYRVFDLSDAWSLQSVLSRLRSDSHKGGIHEQLKRYVFPLFELLSDLHGRGFFLGNANPEWFYFSENLGWRLGPKAILRRLGDDVRSSTWVDVAKGFAAPEVYGRCGGQLSPRTDVYFAGMVLYAVLSDVAPSPGTGQHALRMPPVQAYKDDVPPMLGAVALKATSAHPARRYSDMQAALVALRKASERELRRMTYGARSLEVDYGSEIHIGLVKAMYSPINQDQFFEAFDELTGTGLFLVSDGVSISRYGSGDLASHCVKEAATQLWNRILGPGPQTEPDDTLTFDSSHDLSVSQQKPGRTHAERKSVIEGMLNQANIRIGKLVTPMLPPATGPLESIMAATSVSMFLERNQATISYIGDSRAYLVRDGHIALLTLDHNLKTQLMRNGHPPARAVQAQGANALVKCVGDFERSEDGSLMAVPLEPEHVKLTVLPGDTVVLCSDGIVDYAGFDEEASEQIITDIVESAPTARVAAFELMVAANRGGGGDNISCIVVRFDELSSMRVT
ncbi:MAG: hypothetical protein VYA30_14220 [Myxococcota bacterium]|nr:hypothetical protein [Myxococcota bacterium]